MNKLLFAVTAAACICTFNIASAQMESPGGAYPPMGTEMKHDQETSTTGDSSGTKVEHSKKIMHKGHMHKGKMEMETMDTNKDGMISKEEFMTFHEAMYDSMKKNKDGMVDMKEMKMMHHHMAK